MGLFRHIPRHDFRGGPACESGRRQQRSRRGPSPPRLHLLNPAWQRELLNLRLDACRRILAGSLRGLPIEPLLRRQANRLNGRRFKADPKRRVRMSWETMRRVYYGWLGAGRKRAALALRYGSARKIRPGHLRHLFRQVLKPDTRSFSAAYRNLRAAPAGESAFRYALGPRKNAQLLGLFSARRQASKFETSVRRSLKGASKQ